MSFTFLDPTSIDPITGVKTFKISKKLMGKGGYGLKFAKNAKKARKLSKKSDSWMSYEQEDGTFLVERDKKVTIIQDFGPNDILDLPGKGMKALKGKSFGYDLYPGMAFTIFNNKDETDLGIVIPGDSRDFSEGVNIV